ncbi:hypothetical protein F66182_14068 [Fusarium sp. NRRL 66182]|nr:hypothetical protein F66182_14068 [Fusarium sp. NRRL 66182]
METKQEVADTQTSSSMTEAASSSSRWAYLKHYFTSRDGWIGDYDYMYLITPNIWPLNKKYKDFSAPFYGLNDHVPILLTIILGLQHALTLVGSVVSPPLAIAGGAFYLNSAQTQYLVSAAFITTDAVLHWDGVVVCRGADV